MEQHERRGYWNEVYGNPVAGPKVWTLPDRSTRTPSKLLCTLLFVLICLVATGFFTYQLVKFQRQSGGKEIIGRAHV